MRVLLLTPEFPLPLLNGTRLRNFHLFSRLAQRHDVTLLTFAGSEEMALLPSIKDFFSVVQVVPRIYRRSARDYAWGAFSTVPFFVKRMHSAEMAMQVERLLTSQSYDVVHVSDLRMAHYLVPYSEQAKVIDACDCLSLLYRRAFFSSSRLIDKANYLQLWIRTRSYESSVYPEFDRCIAVSQTDAEELLASSAGLPTTVVPNGVDTDHFYPSTSERAVENSFVFVGTMSYAPNIDAARFFAMQVLPRIEHEAVAPSFRVVGRSPAPTVLALQNTRNVQIVRDVDDIRPHVWRSTVFVCPLRFGAGVKNKLLEAMAMGKPIVATTVACEGLNVASDQEVLIADDALSFSEKCTRVIKEKQVGDRLGSMARLLVEQEYSWWKGVDILEETLTEVARKRWRFRLEDYLPETKGPAPNGFDR